MAKVGRLVKELMVQELTTALTTRPNFFVASLGSLSAAETDTLRKRLRTSQAQVLMVKRTLGLHGLSAMNLDDAKPLWEGSVALVLPGEDIIPVAKLLMDFAKENQDKLTVRGGLVEGQVLDRKRFEELAGLPPKPQLIARLVGILESPLADLVFTVEAVLGEIAWVLEEASKTTSQSAPQATPAPAGEGSAQTQDTGKTQPPAAEQPAAGEAGETPTQQEVT